MIEQSSELIAKARRFANMQIGELSRQSVKTLLVDLAQALEEAVAEIKELES